MSASVEDFGDGAEGFLARSVPNLQLQRLVLYLYHVGAEFDAHRHIVVFLELVVHQSLQHARLPNSCKNLPFSVKPYPYLR